MTQGLAVRIAQLVAVVVSLGFSFGGIIGIVYTPSPALLKLGAFAMLAAMLGLHLYNVVHRSDGRRPAGWQWTLAAQVVLTGAGLIWFAGTWYGNTGFLAAAVLVLIRNRTLAWMGFAAVLVMQYIYGWTVRETLPEVLHLVITHAAFVGVALYGVSRIAALITELQNTRARLATAAVARERLEFAEQLNERVGARLSNVVDRAQAVQHAREPESAREHLTESLTVARTALNEARSIAHGRREPVSTGGRPAVDDLTTRAATVLTVTTVCLMIVPNMLRNALKAELPASQLALYCILLAAFTLLYVRHVLPGDDDGRPRGWVFTLAAQVALAVLPLALFDLLVWHAAYFLAALALVLLRGWLPWIVTPMLVFQDVLWQVFWTGSDSITVLDQAYQAVWIAERAIVVYGLWQMARWTVEVRAARVELARAEVDRECLRFARDLHDLLGYSLSVIALKSELALRLYDRDTPRSRAELAEGIDVARQALADVRSVAQGYRQMSLTSEAANAVAVLAAAEIDTTGKVAVDGLPAGTDTVLATVLREGVTNVLRHSSARTCTISAEVVDHRVRLSLRNDGAGPSTGQGMGLQNLGRRVEELGGTLTAAASAGIYELVAVVPLQPALVGGDADGVDPVPGVQLHDGR